MAKVKTTLITNFRDISFEEFQELLQQVAPKYGKDHKLAPGSAFRVMAEAIASGGPSLAGTTVSELQHFHQLQV